jgi:hypothetical protein
LGSEDPRKNSQGNIDFRIQRQLRSYSREDPPPDRVKPVPVTVIQHIMFVALAAATTGNLAIADMIALAFFFLLHPGEYTATPSDTTPFRFTDVQLFIGQRRLNLLTASDAELKSSTFVTLTFTDQKNGVRGEVIGLDRSGNPQLCPVLCVIRRILHLRTRHAPPDTPLAAYYENNTLQVVSPGDISLTLRTAITVLGPATLGFLPTDVSARSLRASGAMALLCAHVDTDVIRLIGRWRLDEMLRYLYLQADSLMKGFSSKMLNRGNFVLIPNQDIPSF